MSLCESLYKGHKVVMILNQKKEFDKFLSVSVPRILPSLTSDKGGSCFGKSATNLTLIGHSQVIFVRCWLIPSLAFPFASLSHSFFWLRPSSLLWSLSQFNSIQFLPVNCIKGSSVSSEKRILCSSLLLYLLGYQINLLSIIILVLILHLLLLLQTKVGKGRRLNRKGPKQRGN